MPEKTTKERCANCGDWTHFGNAVGERARRKWCGRCWKQYDKYHRTSAKGQEFWLDAKGVAGQRAPPKISP